jgi:ubiquinol-cytochrome c reductase cytochrome b subunit
MNNHPINLRNYGLIKIINSSLIDLPARKTLTINWNFGSLLGVLLAIQLITGILLVIRLTFNTIFSFDRVIELYQEVRYGWLLRLIHASIASIYFLFIYLHIGRGIYYKAYVTKTVWLLGRVIYIISIGIAFLGYVLPWGQMRYWAATVITNLVSALPYVGESLVKWIWGGFAVGNPTLTRFFALHYILPFVVLILVILHLYFLHIVTSSNPLGLDNPKKISFHYYYSVKDLFVVILVLVFVLIFSMIYGYSFIDPENWIPANSLVTPVHIQPEWYFLFAYAILRSIPSKIGGVLALLGSILVLFILLLKPLEVKHNNIVYKLITWNLLGIFIILTWLGSIPAEPPYIFTAQIYTILYFIRFISLLVL